MAKIDLDRLRTLLAERSMKPTDWWSLGKGETGALLADVRELASDANPGTRRQTWDALDQVVDDGNRDDFFALLVCGLDTERFRRLLTDTDPAVRSRTRWMDARGYSNEPFVLLTLELLGDERFDYAWPDCVEVLRRPAQVDILVGALAEAPEDGLAERLWVTLGLPAETRVPEFLPKQSSATDVDCPWDCDPVDPVPAHKCRHLPIALALLGSSLEDVREDAISALCVLGPGVTEVLRSVPRSARREALALLAEFGWQYLPPDDVTVLKRLIRVKQRTELPEPLDFGRLAGSWYALPTTDQTAVLDAFDLRDPVPATMRMGFAPWQGSRPRTLPPGFGMSDLYSEVFVTPVLDGWTLVFYNNNTSMDIRMEQLSVRFGTAHWYEQITDDYIPGVWSQWYVAQDGRLRMHCVSSGEVRIRQSDELDPTAPLDRLYAWLEANDTRREPRPSKAETARVEAYVNMLREHSDERRPLDEDDDEDGATPLQDQVFGARGASRRLSVNLENLGPHTQVQGTGVLAVPAHLRHLVRRGALPL